MKIQKDYFERVYAGWLGKIIGIRFGAYIEGWSYKRIEEVFGELKDYPVNYKNFAADDDSNGPLFLIRALEDCADINYFSSSDVANALLNYAPYEHGFFWWGGYGISTEHTAYLNLRSGIPAPRSGSIEQNGSTMAEQIGGQIFIDPWGLVSPGNPSQAAFFAEKAASVTHGGNGVYGGIYIACCISLAFTEKHIEEILVKALKYIPRNCAYAQAIYAVMDFYSEHPSEWRECFHYIHDNYGYNKYPGNCHIIPNIAVMVLAMLYGEEDFTKTITICNMCGWDTDCNVGNVGCIMGVFCGLDGINYEKWAKPINDFLACSSVIPSLNAVDIPYGASYLAKMAFKLAKEKVPSPWDEILENKLDSCHFEYPSSTHAFRYRSRKRCVLQNSDEKAHSGRRSLKMTVVDAKVGDENYFYKQTYYTSKDFDDSRYDPSFAPMIYPGQTLNLSVFIPKKNNTDMTIQIYAKNGALDEEYRGIKVSKKGIWHTISMQIPKGKTGYISETGIIINRIGRESFPQDLTIYLDDLYFSGEPEYTIDFSELKIDDWNGIHKEIPQFSKLKGHTYLENKYLNLSCSDFGELYTGSHLWKDYRFSVYITPVVGDIHIVNVRVQGAMRSYAAGFIGKDKVGIMKNLYGYKTLCERKLHWKCGRKYLLTVIVKDQQLELEIDGKTILKYQDNELPIRNGGVGISVQKGSHSKYRGMKVSATKNEKFAEDVVNR